MTRTLCWLMEAPNQGRWCGLGPSFREGGFIGETGLVSRELTSRWPWNGLGEPGYDKASLAVKGSQRELYKRSSCSAR